ncbi:hypothetical protein HanOQP8_Chr10g0347931 [Helianthus annuus]|nr:hypothetical protein HanOQP8_Chr10g0347931 [Helianthus annuus]
MVSQSPFPTRSSMTVFHLTFAVRNWWIILAIWTGLQSCSKRNDPSRDEKDFTHLMKSFIVSPHWADVKSFHYMQGDFGWDWAGYLLFVTHGRDGCGLGPDYCNGIMWDGSNKGWVGDIRGWQGSIPYSFSGVCKAVNSFISLVWSLGILLNYTFLILTRSISSWRHVKWTRIGLKPGIGINMGVIRKDRLGGLSLRCSPIWIPTPMLETTVGVRNLLFADYYFVGLGWIKGWDRWLAMNMCWPNVRSSCYEGCFGNLGWVMHSFVILLDPCSCVFYIKVAAKWLHLIGKSWRSKLLYKLPIWLRGKFVNKSWVCISSLHIKMVWKPQIWCHVWLAKRYDCARVMQCNHRSAAKSWACNWVQVCWVGIVVRWVQYELGYKCRQPIIWCWSQNKMLIKHNTVVVWTRGNVVLLGWVKYCQDDLYSDYKWLDVLFGPRQLLFGQCGLLWHSPGCVRHFKNCWLAARDCCLITSAVPAVTASDQVRRGLRGLVLWSRVMWQLYSSTNGLSSMIYTYSKLCFWTKILLLGSSYIMLLSSLLTRNWLNKLVRARITATTTWDCCWTCKLRQIQNHQKWAFKIWCLMLRAGHLLISSYYTIMMKAQTLGLLELLHGRKAWAWTTLWAWVEKSRVPTILEWVMYRKAYYHCFWDMCDRDPYHKCGRPPLSCVFVKSRSGCINPCNTKFHCIPSIVG